MKEKTPFSLIYDSFLSRVTSDMYMEFTELDTFNNLQPILLNAIFYFEFPRFNINDYCEGRIEDLGFYIGVESNFQRVPAKGWIGGYFNSVLTQEEINILSVYMVVEWLGQQLATTENTRMKYSGSDYKLTSQANHMAKLKLLIEQYMATGFHMQRLYKRRKLSKDGKKIESTFGQIMEVPKYGFKV